LGHVDGKKKSVLGMNAGEAEQRQQESNENQEVFMEKDKRQETREELSMQSPHASSSLQGQEPERKFTPMDVDRLEIKIERVEAEVKRNSDGSICKGCNCT
jgi:hypothetical protein